MSEIQKQSGETIDTKFSTGAVRSAAVDHLDFTSIPLVGLIGAARTSVEGQTKYDRLNYMRGMPVHTIINHVIGHYVSFLIGDRSEPHLEHAAWGALAASQSMLLDPELSAPHLLGPGATLTEANRAFLDANAPILAEKRRAGLFTGIGEWNLRDVPEIARLLGQREAVLATIQHIAETLQAEAETEAAPVVEKVKKKRRTKLEMQAARGEVVVEPTNAEIDAENVGHSARVVTPDDLDPSDVDMAEMDAVPA